MRRNPFEEPQPHPQFIIATVLDPLPPIDYKYAQPEPLQGVTLEFGQAEVPSRPAVEFGQVEVPSRPTLEFGQVGPPEERPDLKPRPSPPGQVESPSIEFSQLAALQPVENPVTGKPDPVDPVAPHKPGNAPELPSVEPAPSKEPTASLEPLVRPQVEFGPPESVSPIQVTVPAAQPLPPLNLSYQMPDPLPPLAAQKFGEDRLNVDELLADVAKPKRVQFLSLSGSVSTLSEEGW